MHACGMGGYLMQSGGKLSHHSVVCWYTAMYVLTQHVALNVSLPSTSLRTNDS